MFSSRLTNVFLKFQCFHFFTRQKLKACYCVIKYNSANSQTKIRDFQIQFSQSQQNNDSLILLRSRLTVFIKTKNFDLTFQYFHFFTRLRLKACNCVIKYNSANSQPKIREFQHIIPVRVSKTMIL